MAKRKQKGAAFGKKSGGGSQIAFQKAERSRLGCYAIVGLLGFLMFCFALYASSGLLDFGGGGSSGITSDGDVEADGFDGSADSMTDEELEADSDAMMDEDADHGGDDGFSADSGTVDLEPIEAGEFSLLDGEFSVAALDPVERNGYYAEYPEFIIDESLTYEALLVTEKGDIRVRLFDDQAPLTVNNFVYLAQDGYYDETTFHRVLEGFMAQAGDPTGTGTGGPGYNFADETDNGLSFDRAGLLAMANAGPGTNGSQFFITYDATPWLDGNHTIFGEIIEGKDVLDSIRLRDPQTDPELGDMIDAVEIYVAE